MTDTRRIVPGLGAAPVFVRGAGAWTPASTSPTFWARFDKGSTLTTAGGLITQARDAAGSALVLVQNGATALPAAQANAFGGLSSARFTPSTIQSLYCSTGSLPPMGADHPANIYVLARFNDLSGGSYSDLATVGAASFTIDKQYFLDAYGGTQLAAIGEGAGGGAIGGNADTLPHVYELIYDSGAGTMSVRQDGVLVAGPTTITGLATSGGGFPSGFGFGSIGGGLTSACDIVQAVFRLGGAAPDDYATRAKHVAYLASLPSSPIVLQDIIWPVGNSLCWAAYTDAYPTSGGNPVSGTGVDASNAWIDQLGAQAGMSGWSFTYQKGNGTGSGDSNPGYQTADILAVVSHLGHAPAQASPLRRNGIAVLWGCANDLILRTDPATAIANLDAIYALLAGAGMTVVVCTEFPWPPNPASGSLGTIDASLQTINEHIRATYPHVYDLAADATYSAGLSVSGGVWGGTCDDVRRAASGGAPGHLTVVGQGYFATKIAPMLLALKR